MSTTRTTLDVVKDYLYAEEKVQTIHAQAKPYCKSRMKEYADEFDEHIESVVRRIVAERDQPISTEY